MSIVIVNFNYGRFLGAAIDSALGQSYGNVEVLVVDDGSTDDSRQVISSYGEKISSILKPNGGHASAFNAGFVLSRGEIVIFLDSDDLLLRDAVVETVQIWKPDVSKVQWVLQSVDEQLGPMGTTLPYAASAMQSNDARRSVIEHARYLTPPTSGNAFSRTLLDQLMPLSESFWHQGAEVPLCLLAPFFGEVLSIPKVLGVYRVHGQNHGAMSSELDCRKLRAKLVFDWQRTFTVEEFLDKRGIRTKDWLRSDCGHWKYRMASFCLDPGHHVVFDDNRALLLRRGLEAAWRDPFHVWKSRLFHTVWFTAMWAAPSALGRRLVQSTIGGPVRVKQARAARIDVQNEPLLPPQSVR